MADCTVSCQIKRIKNNAKKHSLS